jgi:catechol 2,3-dioxygenase-like lactoylglutathione lyase family enzyme
MIAHTTLPVRNYAKSKKFYTKVLKTLGYRRNTEYGESAGFNDGKNTDFWISAEKSVAPTHLAFQAGSRKSSPFTKPPSVRARRTTADQDTATTRQDTSQLSLLIRTAITLRPFGTTLRKDLELDAARAELAPKKWRRVPESFRSVSTSG